MTVEELIEKLRDMPPQAVVYVNDPYEDDFCYPLEGGVTYDRGIVLLDLEGA